MFQVFGKVGFGWNVCKGFWFLRHVSLFKTLFGDLVTRADLLRSVSTRISVRIKVARFAHQTDTWLWIALVSWKKKHKETDFWDWNANALTLRKLVWSYCGCLQNASIIYTLVISCFGRTKACLKVTDGREEAFADGVFFIFSQNGRDTEILEATVSICRAFRRWLLHLILINNFRMKAQGFAWFWKASLPLARWFLRYSKCFLLAGLPTGPSDPQRRLAESGCCRAKESKLDPQIRRGLHRRLKKAKRPLGPYLYCKILKCLSCSMFHQGFLLPSFYQWDPMGGFWHPVFESYSLNHP